MSSKEITHEQATAENIELAFEISGTFEARANVCTADVKGMAKRYLHALLSNYARALKMLAR